MSTKTKELITIAPRLAEPFHVNNGDEFRLKDLGPGDKLAERADGRRLSGRTGQATRHRDVNRGRGENQRSP